MYLELRCILFTVALLCNEIASFHKLGICQGFGGNLLVQYSLDNRLPNKLVPVKYKCVKHQKIKIRNKTYLPSCL